MPLVVVCGDKPWHGPNAWKDCRVHRGNSWYSIWVPVHLTVHLTVFVCAGFGCTETLARTLKSLILLVFSDTVVGGYHC